jgi:hypothetical protein
MHQFTHIERINRSIAMTLNSQFAPFSKHAQKRCQQRGIRPALIRTIIENADVDVPAGSCASILSVSRRKGKRLNLGDQVGRLGVVLSEDGTIITIAHIFDNRRGKSWRRGRN